MTYEQASSGALPGMIVYLASKKLAERAAFDYAAEHPELKITTLNRTSPPSHNPANRNSPNPDLLAPMVFGPPLQSVNSPTQLNTSSLAIYQLISGTMKTIQPREEGLPLFVDVRDVAAAHILALKNDNVIGKRVFLSGGPFLYYQVRLRPEPLFVCKPY